MNDISRKISLYQNLYLVCLVLALIFLLTAIALFFLLDIRSTFGYLTGQDAKKKIKELETAAIMFGGGAGGKFVVVREIMLIHTEEII